MKKKLTILSFTFIIIIIVLFNQKIIELYFLNKFSKWVENDVIFEDFQIIYPNIISIKNLEIKNTNLNHYDSIFKAGKIIINLNIKSFLVGDLRIVNNLIIDEPKFYLEIIQKKLQSGDETEKNTQLIFEDNIGIAKKLSQNLPDKIWPMKEKDINFLILKSKISEGIAYVKISSFKRESEISMSNFEFITTGNQKGYQHYKDVLKIMFFDIFARETNNNKKIILKKIYKF
tara:strand:- start:49 stop:741 length:693 start_codon:yes stop_codon:yes gene_type:complete